MKTCELYKSQDMCCGCFACVNICPKEAISMSISEDGCFYPKINDRVCIDCGLCKRVCNYQNKEVNNDVVASYAARSLDEELLKRSSSGGMFSAIAKEIIKKGGIVYGCSVERINSKLLPRHIRVTKLEDIKKIQGTKYVQSQIGDIYKLVKKDLLDGKVVLFSGTPCQIDGLYGFLQNKEYNNLFMMDIICHGTPGVGLFQDYINYIEKKENAEVIDINFRDKSYGWTARGSYTIIKNQKKSKKMINPHNSSYYRLFLDSACYRESCYSCKYASNNRVGDVTVGDFWGIQEAHPEILLEWKQEKGISCLMVNTIKGNRLLEEYAQEIECIDSSFEKISRKNGMLLRPCKNNQERYMVRELYKSKGYASVEKWCWKKQGLKRYIYLIVSVFKRKK